MRQPCRPIDVFGVATFRGNAAIERLPNLADDYEVVDYPLL
jgi:hypothetical protein